MKRTWNAGVSVFLCVGLFVACPRADAQQDPEFQRGQQKLEELQRQRLQDMAAGRMVEAHDKGVQISALMRAQQALINKNFNKIKTQLDQGYVESERQARGVVPYHQKRLVDAEKKNGHDSLPVAFELDSLANVQSMAADNTGAEASYKRALSIYSTQAKTKQQKSKYYSCMRSYYDLLMLVGKKTEARAINDQLQGLYKQVQ